MRESECSERQEWWAKAAPLCLGHFKSAAMHPSTSALPERIDSRRGGGSIDVIRASVLARLLDRSEPRTEESEHENGGAVGPCDDRCSRWRGGGLDDFQESRKDPLSFP